jgi:hypothetical protein
MKRLDREIRVLDREIAAFAIGFGLAIAVVLILCANAPAQQTNLPQNNNQPKPQQPLPPPPKTAMPPAKPPMSLVKPPVPTKDTAKPTTPKDTEIKAGQGTKIDPSAVKGTSGKDPRVAGTPAGKDSTVAGKGTSAPETPKTVHSKESSVDGTSAPKTEILKGKPKDPPVVRPGFPSAPLGVSTPRGGSIVATMPQIGTERWERVHRHHWRHEWDWAHRFWGPDYGTGNTFTFQNTYSPTIENSGNTTQQFDYSRPLASHGTKDAAEQTNKGNGNDSKNNDDVQASKDNTDAGVDAGKSFDRARASFKDADYDKALEQVNAAIEKRPSDATLHEFKALCLFAQGKYKEAAPVLYAVIAAGPGWDSDTMHNLYADEDAYQKQFKSLKDFVAKEPDASYGHFVLAYHYLAQGRKSAAVKELREVTRTQPDDKLSAELLKVLA